MIAINIDGKIKTFSDYPNTWNNISPYQFAEEDIHYEDGFRPFVTPQLTAGQKLGAMVYDAVNDVFTYAIVSKSPADLEQETEAQKEVTRAAIKERYQNIAVENTIALNLTEAPLYFKPYKAGAYLRYEAVAFNGKYYRNTVEGNTNAPDKGGWLEIK